MFPSMPRRIAASLAVATAMTAAIVLVGTAHGSSPVRLSSAESIDIAGGVALVPAPGWTLARRGPNWVALSNADASAQLRVTVKPAGEPDAVAVLQADKDRMVADSSAVLSNERDLSEPQLKTVPGRRFQQEASIDYTADVLGPEGAIPVIGSFTELLNPSTLQSAFVDYRQDNSATPQAVNDGGMMISSMF